MELPAGLLASMKLMKEWEGEQRGASGDLSQAGSSWGDGGGRTGNRGCKEPLPSLGCTKVGVPQRAGSHGKKTGVRMGRKMSPSQGSAAGAARVGMGSPWRGEGMGQSQLPSE